MSEGGNGLFPGEEVGVDLYDVGAQGSDALGRRGDIVRDISGVHEELRDVLSFGWDFEAYSGDRWWDFETRYEGDAGHISVSGRPDGRIEVIYRTESLAELPDYVDDQMEYLDINRNPSDVSGLKEDSEALKFSLEEDVDLDDGEVQRYIKDAVGLYAGVDGDVAFPSVGDSEGGDRWWM